MMSVPVSDCQLEITMCGIHLTDFIPYLAMLLILSWLALLAVQTSWRIHNIAKYRDLVSNCAKELEFGSVDGREDGDHNTGFL